MSTFTCPHCRAYAQQKWSHDFANSSLLNPHLSTDWHGYIYNINECCACGGLCFWQNKQLVYPSVFSLPMPNEDMNEEVQKLCEEARAIISQSPRAASALIRVALEKLLRGYWDRPGKSISEMLNVLINENKLPVDILASIAAIKNIGNDACHPSEIDFNERPEIANTLYFLINDVAESLLTKPRERKELLEQLPKPSK